MLDDSLYTLLMENIKESGAATGATLDLLLSKGLLDLEDIKHWENLKTKHLAQLDQIHSEVQDATFKQAEAMLTNQILVVQEPVNRPTPPKPKSLLTSIISIFRRIYHSNV